MFYFYYMQQKFNNTVIHNCSQFVDFFVKNKVKNVIFILKSVQKYKVFKIHFEKCLIFYTFQSIILLMKTGGNYG